MKQKMRIDDDVDFIASKKIVYSKLYTIKQKESKKLRNKSKAQKYDCQVNIIVIYLIIVNTHAQPSLHEI